MAALFFAKEPRAYGRYLNIKEEVIKDIGAGGEVVV
jgi:hypothetical protein